MVVLLYSIYVDPTRDYIRDKRSQMYRRLVLLYSIYYIIEKYVDPTGNYHSWQKIAIASEISSIIYYNRYM